MLIFVLVMLMISTSDAGTSTQSPRSDLRVYSGEPDRNNEFPFIVLLQTGQRSYVRSCTGSLIAENWVITAAHCFLGRVTVVRYGDYTARPNETTLYSKILKKFRHKDNYRNDVGLALVETIRKPFAKLSTLDYRSVYGLPVKYAGFGLTSKIDEAGPPSMSPGPLLVGEGILIPCINPLYYTGVVVCVASKCSNRLQDSRKGDSGGPLLLGGRVMALVKSPASLRTFIGGGAYTPVSLYLDWIKKVMSSNRLIV